MRVVQYLVVDVLQKHYARCIVPITTTREFFWQLLLGPQLTKARPRTGLQSLYMSRNIRHLHFRCFSPSHKMICIIPQQ